MRWICGRFSSQRHADCIQGCNLTAVTSDGGHVTPFCYDRSCDVPLSTFVVMSNIDNLIEWEIFWQLTGNEILSL